MATVDELLVRIDATTESLRRELKRAESAVGQSASSVGREAKRLDTAFSTLDRSFARINGLIAGMGVAIGASQLWRLARESLDAAGGIGELAAQAGIGTRAFQVYEYAATQIGLSSQEMNNTIGRLTRTIGEAATGTKESADAFKRIGVATRDASGNIRGTEEVLRDVADRIAGIPDAAGRAAVAVDLFGRAGQRLLPLLEGGSAGIDQYAEAAERLGVILDDEAIAKADLAADKLAGLDLVIRKNVQRAFVEAAPAMLVVGEQLGQIIPQAANVLARALELVGNNIEIVGGALAAIAVYKTAKLFLEMGAAALTAARFFLVADGALRRTAVGLALAAAAWAAIKSGIIDTSSAMAEVDAAAGLILADFGAITTMTEEVTSSGRDAVKVFNDAMLALENEAWMLEREVDLLGESAREREALIALEDDLLAMRRAGRAATEDEVYWLESMHRSVAALRAEIKASDYEKQLREEVEALRLSAMQQAVLNALRAAGFEVTSDAVDAEGRLTEAYGETAEAIADLAATKFREEALRADLERFMREVTAVADDVATDVTEAIYFGFRDGFDSVEDFLQSWLDRIALEILKQQFVLPITAELVGFAPGLFGIAGPSAGGTTGTTATSTWATELGGLFDDVAGAFDDVLSGLGDFLGLTTEATSSAADIAAGLVPGLGDVAAGPTAAGLGFGDLLGGAGTGLAIGSLLGAVTGGGAGSSIGGSVGGLIGAGIGSIVPGVGTLLGSIIGSIGGGLFGGLFGGGESVGPNSAAWLSGQGGVSVINTGADNGGNEAGARDFGNAIIDLVDRSLAAVGGELGEGMVRLVTGSFTDQGGIFVNPTGIYGSGASNPANRWFGTDQESAAMYAASVILQQAGVEGIAQGMVRSLRTALEEAADTEELESFIGVINLAFGDQAEEMGQYEAALQALNETYDDALEMAERLGIAESRLTRRREQDIRALGDEFVQGLDDAILQATDPEAFALLELDRWREEQLAEAEALGRGLAEIEELYGIRRQQIAEQYAQQANDTLERFLDELTGGDLAGLSPRAQLATDRREFNQALAAALGGDEEAAASLADLGRDLLRTAQEFYSFTPDYFAIRDQVEQAIRDVMDALPGFASGTNRTPAGAFWVGEQGPELMVGEGAQIIPHPASVALMDRMAEWRMPALPTFDLGGGGGEGLAAGLTIDFAGVEQAIREGNAINAANGREFAKLSERVTRLEQENARLRSTMQPVAAAAGRNLAQPSSSAGPRKRNAA